MERKKQFIKILSIVLIAVNVLLFFFFLRNNTTDGELSKEQTENKRLVFVHDKLSVEIEYEKKTLKLQGLSFPHSKIKVVNSRKGYVVFNGTASEVINRKNRLRINNFKGKVCDGDAELTTKYFLIDLSDGEIIGEKVKITKSEHLIYGLSKRKAIDFEKVCSFIRKGKL
ncbi:MAG: hypothetical protein ABGX27_02560 [Desulfurobacteriaceae bacterium]